MGFNTRVVLHVLGLLLTISLLAWCIGNTQYYATMLTLSLLLAFQVASLLRYVHSTNRQLARFMEAIRHADFTQNFRQRGPGSSFRQLGQAFDELIIRFRQERSDRETQATYLHAFVDQLPIAVLALVDNDNIPISNTALRRLLGRQYINHLRQLDDFDPELASACRELLPGSERVLEINRDGEALFLTLSCSILRSGGRQQKLISIQNIQSAMEAREMRAWQNLIRVMTHEIMNSITPITSLADTSSAYLREIRDSPAQHSGDTTATLDDVEHALATIRSRGEALMRFVENYRSLTRLPAPRLRRFQVSELFDSVTSLMEPQAREAGVAIERHIRPATLALYADPDLLEQAMINLIRNAIDARAGNQEDRITLQADMLDRGRVALAVEDNGQGIEAEHLENVFIPFFTTRRGGSGIGMSIVKQIVSLNGGRINVQSSPGQGTVVTINF